MNTILFIIIILFTIGTTFFITKVLYSKKINQQEQPPNEGTNKVKQHESNSSQKNEELDSNIKAEYETKLNKLKSDYDDEIKKLKEGSNQALKRSQQQIKELEEYISHLSEKTPTEIENEEIKRLKKNISSLEDDIEDLEDDCDDLNKRLKKNKEEYSELQDEFDKMQSESKKMQNQLEEVKNELNDKKEELSLKMESLSFIQEILCAPLVNDDDTKNLHKNINRLIDFVKNDLRDCLTQVKRNNLSEKHSKLLNNDLEKWAIQEKKNWIKHKTTIAFIGEFSAGKTSIVNRILSQDDPNVPLLPVSTKATTAIPTYISGGVKTRYQFVTPNNEIKSISENTFKKVNKEILDQVKGISSLIKYFVMTYNNDNLRNISILDTPGFNSNDSEDEQRTIEVINECDALFWVFDVNTGQINNSSLNSIKKNLQKPLYIVINKTDGKAESEIRDVENLITKTLENAGIKINGIIKFSKKTNLEDIMRPIKSIQHDASSENYIQDLDEFIQKVENELNTDTNNQYHRYEDITKECENIDQQYTKATTELKRHCQNAEEIPHFEEHIFRKDNYEMSQDEYKNLQRVLSKISNNDTSQLKQWYNLYMEKVTESVKAHEKYLDMKGSYLNINNNYEKFKKIKNSL